MQDAAVGIGNRLLHGGNRESLREQRARSSQRHEPIGLYRQRLIEVGGKT